MDDASRFSDPTQRNAEGRSDPVFHTRTVAVPFQCSPSSVTILESRHASEFQYSLPAVSSTRAQAPSHDHTRTVLSNDPDTSHFPEDASDVTAAVCPASVRTHFPDDQRHTRTVVSGDPEARRSCSGWAARARTGFECPSRVCRRTPESASQSRINRSLEPAARSRPSASHATAVTSLEIPVSVHRQAQLARSQSRTVSSHDPEARRVPLESTARPQT